MRQGSRILFSLVFLSLAVAGCAKLKKPADQNATEARELSFRGLDAMQRKNWSKAEQLFGEAVIRCPSDERAQSRYAETLWRRGSADEAIAHMEKAVQLSGTDAELFVQLGEMYLSVGKIDKAGEQADEAIRADRQLAKAWALQGDIYIQRGNHQSALASYHRAVSLQEHYPRVQLAIADIYQRTEQPQRMLATLQSLADHYPAGKVPSGVAQRHAVALKSLGRYDDAVEMLAKAAESGNASADLLYQLADLQMFLGDAANAHLSVMAALTRDPNHQPGRQLKAAIEQEQRGMTAVAERFRIE